MQVIVPVITRPIRQVRPMIFPCLFLMALILCKVPAIPDLLSDVNSGIFDVIKSMSSDVTVSVPKYSIFPFPMRISGNLPISRTISMASSKSPS